MISINKYDDLRIEDNYKKYKDKLLSKAVSTVRRALTTKYLRVPNNDFKRWHRSSTLRVKPDQPMIFFEDFDSNIRDFIAFTLDPGNGMIVSFIIDKINILVPDFELILDRIEERKGRKAVDKFYTRLVNSILNSDIETDFADTVFELFSREETVIDLLRKNKIYKRAIIENELAVEKRGAVSRNIVTVMPERYKDLYPETRKLRRHFVIHYGPTNSGKTYQAMQALKNSEYGVYLSPLRMLALEKYDELNFEGFPCSLRTGEEEKIVEDARYVASTIEMADFDRQYDCAVIDECQMITDKFRGGAWTAAILGLQADEIHLCMSPWAVEPIESMIKECGDTIEYVEHKRNTELHAEKEPFEFPKDIRDHDAIILFSRKHVHSVAAELEKRKIKCSVIYGNLPYDVRQNEARRFRTGETKVVVSTDAIGMGLNLPIKRVVFLQMEKFDGVEKRYLEPEEIRQIAGRAGRRGIFDTGSAVSTSKQRNKHIEEAINNMAIPDKKPMIGFPDSLIGIDERISVIMQEWDKIPPMEGFEKANLEEIIFLAEEAEKITEDKQLVYRLARINLDTKNQEQVELWRRLSKQVVNECLEDLPEVYYRKDNLLELERTYQIFDVYYQFGRVFANEDLKEAAMLQKEKISRRIIRLLKEKGKESRKCKKCGRPLPWNYQFNICQSCFNDRYR